MKSEEQDTWVFQDSSTNDFQSMVIYAPIEINSIQSVMSGCGSSNTAILASGFSILPDGIEYRLSLISKTDKDIEGGSLLTIAFQILITDSPTEKVPTDSVNTLISCMLQNIKKSFQCEEIIKPHVVPDIITKNRDHLGSQESCLSLSFILP